jgi:hypothetical protein
MATQTFPEDLQVLRRTVTRHFPDLVDELEIALAVCASLKIQNMSQPLAIWFLGAPSSGKTTVLDCIGSLPMVLTRDDFSAASILSASAGMDEQDSLLPQLDNHILCTPELAPLTNSNQVKVVLSYMTRLLDSGTFVRHSGSTGRIGFTSPQRWSWLGALVDVSPTLFSNMGSMGHRVLHVRMQTRTRTFEARTSALVRLTRQRPYAAKLQIIRRLVVAFFENLDRYYPDGIRMESANDDEWAVRMIANFATLMVSARSVFQKSERKSIGVPLTEHENRAFFALYGLAQAVAFLHGRSYVTPQELKTVARVALDSAPVERSDMLRYLINNNEIGCDQYVSSVGCSTATASIRFRQMIKLGLAEKITKPGTTKPYYNITLHHDYTWILEDRLRQFLPPSEIW